MPQCVDIRQEDDVSGFRAIVPILCWSVDLRTRGILLRPPLGDLKRVLHRVTNLHESYNSKCSDPPK